MIKVIDRNLDSAVRASTLLCLNLRTAVRYSSHDHNIAQLISMSDQLSLNKDASRILIYKPKHPEIPDSLAAHTNTTELQRYFIQRSAIYLQVPVLPRNDGLKLPKALVR